MRRIPLLFVNPVSSSATMASYAERISARPLLLPLFALIGFVLGIHHQVKRRAFNVNQMTNNILFHQGHLTCFAAGHDGRRASGNLSRIPYTNADSSTSSYLQIVEYTPSDDRCSSMDGKGGVLEKCRYPVQNAQMKRTGRTG